jgi:hypothetical protein
MATASAVASMAIVIIMLAASFAALARFGTSPMSQIFFAQHFEQRPDSADGRGTSSGENIQFTRGRDVRPSEHRRGIIADHSRLVQNGQLFDKIDRNCRGYHVHKPAASLGNFSAVDQNFPDCCVIRQHGEGGLALKGIRCSGYHLTAVDSWVARTIPPTDGRPASIRLRAIALPMAPRPMKPTCMALGLSIAEKLS